MPGPHAKSRRRRTVQLSIPGLERQRIGRPIEDTPEPLPIQISPAAERARATEAAHLAYHGPGMTFGELELGEPFAWAPPIPRGPAPIYKRSSTRYSWAGGFGTAEPYYRVVRWEGE